MKRKIVGILICILLIGVSSVQVFVKSDAIKINENNAKTIDCEFFNFYAGCKGDTRIDQHNPDTNYGKWMLITSNMYGTTPDYEQDILIKFDFSSIPSSASITWAKLCLCYCDYNGVNPVGRLINCHRITSDWDEMSVTWNTRPSYSPDITSTVKVPLYGAWMKWDVKEDVHAFVSGSKTNYGWQLMDETYWGNDSIPQTIFAQREIGPVPYMFMHIEDNNPPNTPSTPVGKINGTVNVSYSYTTNATDPDGDQVYYFWDWGDGTNSSWIGPYQSGEICEPISHKWSEKGSYILRVKSKDEHGDQNFLWATLTVTMPKNKMNHVLNSLLDRLLNYLSFIYLGSKV